MWFQKRWTFIRATKSLKNFTLMGSFCPKHIMFQLENFRELCVMTPTGVAKFKEKMTCGLKNDIRNLVNFHGSSRKSGNLLFDRILLPKAYKDLDEKVQKSYVSKHWRVMQSLRKNWLLVPETKWETWWILTGAVANKQHIKFQLKKYRRTISHDTEKRSKLWRKTDFLFENWHEEFAEL